MDNLEINPLEQRRQPTTNLKTQYCPLCFMRLCLQGSEASIVFPGFCFSLGKHSIAWKEIFTPHASGLFKLALLKYVLKCCLINKVHE